MTDAVTTDNDTETEAPPEPVLLHGCPTSVSCGQDVVHASAATYIELMRKLLDDGYHQCLDVCGVDYLTHPGRTLPEGVVPERFEVVVSLLDREGHRRMRVRAQVPATEPVLPSLFDLWPGTEAMERETFDMFGIAFDGHPDLTRILMPEDWIGHPLRKDYEPGRIPVQFSAGHAAPPTRRAGA